MQFKIWVEKAKYEQCLKDKKRKSRATQQAH